jgi:beta-hydroxylase
VSLELIGLRMALAAGWLTSAAAVHFRGRVRHGFLRQLVDHSTFVAPYNLLTYAFSAIPRRPILDADDFPDLLPLRENWEIIRDEAVALFEAGHTKPSEERADLAFNTFFRRGWTRFYVKWYDDTLPSARELCPRTVALVDAIPSVSAALFAVLPPGGKLGQHRDPFAGSLRLHLGLATPNSDACRIWVDGEPYSWRDGEAAVFDQTYVHEVRNDTDEHRIILFCDVTRPLHQPMRTVNDLVSRHLVKATSARNADDERLGLLNRFAGAVQRGKERMKRIKRWNKPLYRVGKAVVLGGLVYLILLHGII